MGIVHCYFKKDITTPFLTVFKNASGILKEMGQKCCTGLSWTCSNDAQETIMSDRGATFHPCFQFLFLGWFFAWILVFIC